MLRPRRTSPRGILLSGQRGTAGQLASGVGEHAQKKRPVKTLLWTREADRPAGILCECRSNSNTIERSEGS
jgi:hypothetical protein